MKSNALPHLLHAFFHQWMGEQRNLSHHTVLSYRDTWRLLLRFVAARHSRAVVDLTLSELTAKDVLAFLNHSENERHVSVGTRNCRLAAIRSFFRFVVEQEPPAAVQGAQILRIPIKKAVKPALSYLDLEEVTAILRQPDRSTLEGQRDHTLLAFLYNTGARIQEALDLCPQAIRFKPPLQVRLLGKGSEGTRLSTVAGNSRPSCGTVEAATSRTG
jgi:site-specific recombinase XerD